MSIIYVPKGRAREYASLACNVYAGCDHGCIYCYAPNATFKSRDEFIASRERPNVLDGLVREAAKLQRAGVSGQVLLCFTCDPYQHLEKKELVTRKAIQILHDHGFTVCVLTKGGSLAVKDLHLFTPDDAFATTMTLLDDDESRHWEPGAALPGDRIWTIREFHNAGIPTWVSLEPVLDPNTALGIIRLTHEFVDLYKVGRLNPQVKALPEANTLARSINWPAFRGDAIALLEELGYERQLDPDAVQSARANNRQFYVKHDLEIAV